MSVVAHSAQFSLLYLPRTRFRPAKRSVIENWRRARTPNSNSPSSDTWPTLVYLGSQKLAYPTTGLFFLAPPFFFFSRLTANLFFSLRLTNRSNSPSTSVLSSGWPESQIYIHRKVLRGRDAPPHGHLVTLSPAVGVQGIDRKFQAFRVDCDGSPAGIRPCYLYFSRASKAPSSKRRNRVPLSMIEPRVAYRSFGACLSTRSAQSSDCGNFQATGASQNAVPRLEFYGCVLCSYDSGNLQSRPSAIYAARRKEQLLSILQGSEALVLAFSVQAL